MVFWFIRNNLCKYAPNLFISLYYNKNVTKQTCQKEGKNKNVSFQKAYFQRPLIIIPLHFLVLTQAIFNTIIK